MRYALTIESMHCAHCAANIERYLRTHPGVEAASVDFEAGTGWIETPAETDIEALVTAIESMGYPASIQR